MWSVSMVLYNLLTNVILYELPHPSDISFRYYILARGLSSRPINERTVDILSELFDPGQEQVAQAALMQRAIAHLDLGPSALQLLEHVLEMNPAHRWTLAQAIDSDFVQGGD